MTSTTVDALKNLYVALGGKASDVADLNVIPDVINAIAGLGAIKASGNLSTDANGNMSITSSGNITIETTDTSPDGNILLKKGDANITVGDGGNIEIISASELLLRSADEMDIESTNKEINITSKEDMSITAEGASIVVNADGGDLRLKGDDVYANDTIISQ